MSTDRAAFEVWALLILGDNPTWKESGECELAWQSWSASRKQAQAVEPVCGQCKGLGYYDEGHENDDGSMSGGNYVNCACNKKDFTQCTTVTNDCLGGCKSLFEHQNYTHPAPPPAGDHVEHSLTMGGERAELIERQRSVQENGITAEMRELAKATADMLEADADAYAQGRYDESMAQGPPQSVWDEMKAQQVAVPVALAAWLQWCLDNCDDSPEYNFGTTATEHMRALLAGYPAPMPPTQGAKP